jgi:phosphoglycerol transferase MdoB-like AlkP superfamily enzyme
LQADFIRLSLVKIYILTLVLGVFFRVSLFFIASDYFAQVPLQSMLQGVFLGIVVDSVFAGSLLLAVQVLALLFTLLKRERSFERFTSFTMSVALSFFVLAGISDLIAFYFLKSKLRIPLIINNLDQLEPIVGTVFSGLSPAHYVMVFFVAAGLVLATKKLSSASLTPRVVELDKSIGKRLLRMAFFLFASLLWFKEPLWRIELISKLPATAWAVGNSGIYSASMDAPTLLLRRKTTRLMSSSEAQTLFAQYFHVSAKGQDSKTNRKVSLPSEFKQNVVIILMEYMGAFLSKKLTPNGKDLTPNLDKIASESIAFSRGFASSTRTNHGFVTVLTGFPSILDLSVIRLRNGRSIPTIASALPEYESTFLYSGDAGFDHMNAFAAQGGFKKIISDKELLEQNPSWAGKRTEWGFPDPLFLEFLNRYSASLHSEKKPFLTVALTTSNHEPFQLPEKFYEAHPDLKRGSVEAGAVFADQAIGEFFEKAKKEPYYQDTIFVFVADHSRMRSAEDEILKGYNIPMVIHSAKLKDRAQDIESLSNQVDVPATIVGLLNRPFPAFVRFGRDLFVEDDARTPFSASRNGDNVVFCEDGLSVRLNLVSGVTQLSKFDRYANTLPFNPVTEDEQRRVNRLLEKGKAYLQTVSDVLHGFSE